MRNRFKGLDLIDRVPDELWMEVHDIVQETGIKTIPKKKKCKKAKWLSEEDLQISRSMNQGKLEVVKQEMARVNVDILGISELKWTGMGEFNSDQISRSVVSDSFRPHESQHTRPPCPSPTPRVH